jgi:hypothetical protein
VKYSFQNNDEQDSRLGLAPKMALQTVDKMAFQLEQMMALQMVQTMAVPMVKQTGFAWANQKACPTALRMEPALLVNVKGYPMALRTELALVNVKGYPMALRMEPALVLN